MAATGPGFLGAALAVRWTVAEIISTSLNSSRIAERLVRAAPLCVAGCGVAIAWPHLSARLIRTVNALEGAVAARWLFAGFAVLTVIGSFQTVGR